MALELEKPSTNWCRISSIHLPEFISSKRPSYCPLKAIPIERPARTATLEVDGEGDARSDEKKQLETKERTEDHVVPARDPTEFQHLP